MHATCNFCIHADKPPATRSRPECARRELGLHRHGVERGAVIKLPGERRLPPRPPSSASAGCTAPRAGHSRWSKSRRPQVPSHRPRVVTTAAAGSLRSTSPASAWPPCRAARQTHPLIDQSLGSQYPAPFSNENSKPNPRPRHHLAAESDQRSHQVARYQVLPFGSVPGSVPGLAFCLAAKLNRSPRRQPHAAWLETTAAGRFLVPD